MLALTMFLQFQNEHCVKHRYLHLSGQCVENITFVFPAPKANQPRTQVFTVLAREHDLKQFVKKSVCAPQFQKQS